MAISFDSEIKRKLTERLDEKYFLVAEAVARGTPNTMEEYRRQTGYLAALRDVHAMLKEIEKAVLGDARPAEESR